MDRKAIAAGTFYPGNEKELTEELTILFSSAVSQKWNNVRAIIVPHAGYVYSGKIAASAFNQIPENANFERIFIIASSHHVANNMISTYNQGNYKSPLGIVTVDCELTTSLIQTYDFIKYIPEADTPEHSIEVQLPFISYYIKGNYKIVPLLICTNNTSIIESLAQVLLPYFNHNNLFIISTDFSHYPSYTNANKVDNETAEAICLNNKTTFIETRYKHKHSGISELSTDLCGWTSVLCLLHITQNLKTVDYHKIDYANSGDSEYGDTSHVVGYCAIAVTETTNDFYLQETDKKTLLTIARRTIELFLTHKKVFVPDKSNLSKTLLKSAGAFVTLYYHGNLRGCIGQFESDTTLCDVVIEMAISATEDHRFSKVTIDEINELSIEISVLTPMRKISSIDEFELGKHGIYIKKGLKSGTYLPQVAENTHWNKEQFLGHCCYDKAGLDWDEWKTADLYVYESIIIKE